MSLLNKFKNCAKIICVVSIIGISTLQASEQETRVLYNTSKWAAEEVEELHRKNLVPNILKGKDYTKPLTREEFAELALLTYCHINDTDINQVRTDEPFTDTTNPNIGKAYNLGIVNGVSQTNFNPNEKITRQDIAVMVYRQLKARDEGQSTTAVLYNDRNEISDYTMLHYHKNQN